MTTLSPLPRAIGFALVAHGDQRYGEIPYASHLQDAVAVLLDMDVRDENLHAMAWIHDTIEDTNATVELLTAEFGVWIALGADACGSRLPDRHDKMQDIYAKLARNPYAIPVKVADRIANMEACVRTDDKRRGAMYLDEAFEFSKKLGLGVRAPGAARFYRAHMALFRIVRRP